MKDDTQRLQEALAFIQRWMDIIVGGDNIKTLEGWAQEFVTEAQEIIASK